MQKNAAPIAGAGVFQRPLHLPSVLVPLAVAVFIAGTIGGMLPEAMAQKIPQGQTSPPGPALSPAEAIKKMTVPEGFTVEVVASEPQLINPVAMTFDEQGRIWVTESVEYPRSSPGEGKDRIKVLEDTDSDGAVDKVTVFATGLNIPSGIAVGHGGVWVANAPDLLLLKDTDGDLKADQREVIVSGFGRTDTHELPNSLTWGPDGWLYGLNGVFNHSHVRHQGKEFKFTCALFRVHPLTREFQLFCEGTSNPWGVAFDTEGSAFVSACVIDHLWHLTESGYYHRQGGPYPPFTWKIDSIVKHKHQKAAYCGIHYYDSDAYPEEYRQRLYMGNIHGNCLNVDSLERRGSTYFGKGHPDFLSANDAWFMPVAQKTGPDGCLYVLDWYDRYHCYQDARRDPEGIDRGQGRLYRIRYQNTPRAAKFNLGNETDEQLLERLASGNGLIRDLAQRILSERLMSREGEQRSFLTPRLETLARSGGSRRQSLAALWVLVAGGELREPFALEMLQHADPTFRAWTIRGLGNAGKAAPAVGKQLQACLEDDSRDVLLQLAIAAPKLEALETVGTLVKVAARCGDDTLIPHVVWQNLVPRLKAEQAAFLKAVKQHDLKQSPGLAQIMPRATELMISK
ncbi:MAG: hypothetical protein KDB14_23725 [Planctomycetales bacterium]|nr:hypothetical protein [Planctomycetales bacterium]